MSKPRKGNLIARLVSNRDKLRNNQKELSKKYSLLKTRNEELEIELDNANSKLSELSNRILKALDYINEKAPKVSTLILDTKNKVKLLAILKGANEKELYKATLKGGSNE